MSIWTMTEDKSPYLYKLLREGIKLRASDLHLASNTSPVYRIDGQLHFTAESPLNQRIMEEVFMSITNSEQQSSFITNGEVDFSITVVKLGRCRINAYRTSGDIALALRFIPNKIPNIDELNLPSIIKELLPTKNGLVLLCGATGTGKSTTLAAMLDWINQTRKVHILTLEDPIEFFHEHNQSLISQREIPSDSKSFANALRAALREDPDVLMIGEMRDSETAAAVLTAAETGHLVFASLHTNDAVQAIERIVDMFPPYQQEQIRYQLALSLRAVIVQNLLPLANKPGRIAALEILLNTPAVANMIRNAKTHQLLTIMQTSSNSGMQTMAMAIETLINKGLISAKQLINKSAV